MVNYMVYDSFYSLGLLLWFMVDLLAYSELDGL